MNIKQSKIWERILETGHLDELEYLLRLVIFDEESIQVILKKFQIFDDCSKKIRIDVDIHEVVKEENILEKSS